MNGLKGALQASLPASWESVLRKHKILTKFINGLYKSLDEKEKGTKKLSDGRPAWKHGLDNMRIKFKYVRRLDFCMEEKYAREIGDNKFWNDIWYEIQSYEYYNHLP